LSRKRERVSTHPALDKLKPPSLGKRGSGQDMFCSVCFTFLSLIVSLNYFFIDLRCLSMESLKEAVRFLRKNQTKAEGVFWQAVRNRQLNGKKITRQFAIIFNYENSRRFFIADFICFEHKVVIEIDGKIHLKQKDYDEMRSHIINVLGYRVIRFKNEDVIDNIEKVKKELMDFLEGPPVCFSPSLGKRGPG